MGTDRQPGEPVVPAAELEGEPDEVFTQFPAAAAEPPAAPAPAAHWWQRLGRGSAALEGGEAEMTIDFEGEPDEELLIVSEDDAPGEPDEEYAGADSPEESDAEGEPDEEV